MSAREDILSRIRAATARGRPAADRVRALKDRLAAPPRVEAPGRVRNKSRSELIGLLKEHLVAQSASVIAVGDRAQLPAAVAGYLERTGAVPRIRLGSDDWLSALPWHSAPALSLTRGAARGDDSAGLSRAVAAIAETGTLMLLSGPENPVTLAFLPETHIVVLDAADVVGSYEQALDVLRNLTSAGGLPRTVNLISGPSRTADICGILVTGAHGPRQLAVMLVG